MYLWGAAQLTSLQITERRFTHAYASTKHPSRVLHPHVPPLSKAAPATRQTERDFLLFPAPYLGEVLFLGFQTPRPSRQQALLPSAVEAKGLARLLVNQGQQRRSLLQHAVTKSIDQYHMGNTKNYLEKLQQLHNSFSLPIL